MHLRAALPVLEDALTKCSKCVWGDAEATHLLFRAAEDLARAEAPEPITRAFMTATMTALRKPDGGVRGIATGTSFRRLVAKTLAHQFVEVVESTCAPFQFALSTRAGTDCVGHTIRCRLVVMANEVGGRWSPEALAFLRQLAKAKARHEPPLMQRQVCGVGVVLVWVLTD